jgi:ATP-dependent Lhr-like helicase
MWGRLSPHPALAQEGLRRAQEGCRTAAHPPDQARADRALQARGREALIVTRDGEENGALSHAAREVLEEIGRAARRSSPTSCAAQTSAGRSGRSALAARRRRAGDRRRLRCAALADRREAPARRERAARAAALVERALDAALVGGERIDADAFARRLLARWGVVFRDVVARERSRRRGASCCARCAGWKRAARFAAAASSRATSANSSRCPKRSKRCAPPLRIANALIAGSPPRPSRLHAAG